MTRGQYNLVAPTVYTKSATTSKGCFPPLVLDELFVGHLTDIWRGNVGTVVNIKDEWLTGEVKKMIGGYIEVKVSFFWRVHFMTLGVSSFLP